MGRTTEESRWWDEILHCVQNDTGEIPLSLPLRKGEVLSFDRLRMSGGNKSKTKSQNRAPFKCHS